MGKTVELAGGVTIFFDKYYTAYRIHKLGLFSKHFKSYRGINDFIRREFNHPDNEFRLNIKAMYHPGGRILKYIVKGVDLADFIESEMIFK